MTVVLADNALVTEAAVKAYLRITGSGEDDAIRDVINRASQVCANALGRSIVQRLYTDVRLPEQRLPDLWLDGPVDAEDPLTVTIEGAGGGTTDLSVWRSQEDGPQSTFDVILRNAVPGDVWGPQLLHRRCGWQFGCGVVPDPVIVTYTGGFEDDAIPEDIREACLLVCQKIYRDQSRALADVATVSYPSGSMSLLDGRLPRRAEELLLRHDSRRRLWL